MNTATAKLDAQVEYIRYDGDNHEEIIQFTIGVAKYESAVGSAEGGDGGLQSYSQLTLETMENQARPDAWLREDIICEGDYVVRLHGKFYWMSKYLATGLLNVS